MLHDAGCPDDCIQPLTGCLLKGLGLYTRSLAALLRHGPQALLREEEWMVGAPTRDSLATTQLPGRLQVRCNSSVCSMCHGSLLCRRWMVSAPSQGVTLRCLPIHSALTCACPP